jgi:hypothetical protein
MENTMLKLTAKQKYWSAQLLKADAFEGSLSQYAQTQNISVQILYRWRSYFRRSSTIETKTKPAFTQVISAPAMDFCIRLQLGNIQLHFARLPDPRWLSEFVTATHAS